MPRPRTENLLLELARGGAMASRPGPEAVVAAVRAALDGAVEHPRPWPVSSAEDWRKRFQEALAGLWPVTSSTPPKGGLSRRHTSSPRPAFD